MDNSEIRHRLGVILNPDGVLLDSSTARAQAWTEALREVGKKVTLSDVMPVIHAVPNELLLQLYGYGDDTEEGRAVLARARAIFDRRYGSRIAPLYRARDLVGELLDRGIRVQLASPEGFSALGDLLRTVDAESLLHRAVTVDRGGPMRSTRDLLKLALDRVLVSAQQTVVLTASPADVEAAKGLGLKSIALLTGGARPSALAGATQIYPDPAALFADLGSSLFATE